MARTTQVFISHATRADGAFANRLAQDLQRLGVRTWIAPENIRPGERWVDAIERGLQESSHVVVVLTPAALQSSWVEMETDVAIRLEREGRIQVIPLDVEPCAVPLLLGAYQMASFRRGYDVGLRQLADILGLRAAPPPRPSVQAPQTSAQVQRRFTELLAELLGSDPEAIHVGSRLSQDLEMDELDVVELVMAVEDEWGMQIPDGDIRVGDDPADWKLKTVGDWVTYLTRQLGR